VTVLGNEKPPRRKAWGGCGYRWILKDPQGGWRKARASAHPFMSGPRAHLDIVFCIEVRILGVCGTSQQRPQDGDCGV
jgi:hypothetical protein